jgi:hypothetical protein
MHRGRDLDIDVRRVPEPEISKVRAPALVRQDGALQLVSIAGLAQRCAIGALCRHHRSIIRRTDQNRYCSPGLEKPQLPISVIGVLWKKVECGR